VISLIQHIVAFKTVPGLPEEKLAEAIDRLNALRDTVPTVLSLSAGRNFVTDPARSLGYNAGLVATFADRDALAAYIRHPAHQEVLKLLRETMESWLVIDYEV